jgi:deferrochelatase/peroxidase EfeB
MPKPARDNIQGLVIQRYGYPLARYFLLKVADAALARACLRGWLPKITRGDDDLSGRPEPLLNIGVTWRGLVALMSAERLAGAETDFPADFRDRPPAAIAGTWKGRFTGDDVHILVCMYCVTEARLADASRLLRQDFADSFIELQSATDGDPAITARSLGGRKLHFGFLDGISEPAVNWDDAADRPDLVDMRQFLLGYWSEEIQSFPREGRWAELVRDGSYGAFQWIYQDVALFERFLTANAALLAPELPPEQAHELLAAKMMGRWRNGTPMALSPLAPDPALSTATAFGYADDPTGLRCPLTAHIRLANPRDQPLTAVAATTVPKGGPQLLRRGLPYGPEQQQGELDDGVDRGLVGLFLCANLRTQFFLIMSWINKADFSPVFDFRRLRWQDMLVGNRATPGAVVDAAIPMPSGEVLLHHLPQFLHWHGTLLLLFPGLSGLDEITNASDI